MLNAEEVLVKYKNTIYKAANKFYYPNSRFDLEDLVEEGRVVAINASRSFRPELKIKFITYLTNALNRELFKFVNNNAFDTHVPETDARNEFHREGNIEGLYRQANAISLDLPLASTGGDDDEGEPAHVSIPSGNMPPDEALIHLESIQILREEIGNLPERDQAVIQLRYFDGLKLREIADRMNISKQAAAVWVQKSMDKLTYRMKARLGDGPYE